MQLFPEVTDFLVRITDIRIKDSWSIWIVYTLSAPLVDVDIFYTS